MLEHREGFYFQNAMSVWGGKERSTLEDKRHRRLCRFIPVLGELSVADIFCVALLDELQYLKLIDSCCLIFNVCFIYQNVFTQFREVSHQQCPCKKIFH